MLATGRLFKETVRRRPEIGRQTQTAQASLPNTTNMHLPSNGYSISISRKRLIYSLDRQTGFSEWI